MVKNKYVVIKDSIASGHIEKVLREGSEFPFIRVRIDSEFGPIYLRPSFSTKEYFALELLVDKDYK